MKYLNTESTPGLKHSILYAEDDDDDRQLFLDAVSRANLNIRVISVQNGIQALQYLAGVKAQSEVPCVIISDLQMPLKNGMELLEDLKKTAKWQGIPVVLLSTSSSIGDIDKATRLGASSFFSKPDSYHDAIQLIKNILSICLQTTNPQCINWHS